MVQSATSPTLPQLVWILERRVLAAEAMAAAFREAGFVPHVGTTPAAASSGALAVWSLPMSRGDLSWLAEAQSQAGRVRLLARGDGLDPQLQTELLLAGAAGYIEQREPWTTLLQATQHVASGGRWFSRATLSQSIDVLRQPGGGARPDTGSGTGLTERELQVARRVALGEANKEIADGLGVSVSTVKTHLQNIFAKLEVESRVALALHAAAQPRLFGLEAHRR